MPPTKAKMYPKTGKLKTLNKSAPPAAAAPAIEPPSATEVQAQFELELCWCIQTLEASIGTGKLNAKQVQETQKTIKILQSGTQPLIKKRQVMRTAFGDYRARMAEEERKMRQDAPRIEFAPTAASVSYFVKKSVLQSMGSKEFKFEFPVTEQMTQLDLSDNQAAEASSSAATSSADTAKAPPKTTAPISQLKLASTDNSFRFNFNVEAE